MTILYLTSKPGLEYVGQRELTILDENPKYSPDTHNIEDRYIYNPFVSSIDVPPVPGDNQTVVLVDGAWVVVDDYRGMEFYDTSTREKHTITSLGEVPDSAWTDQRPDPWQIWVNGAWIDDFSAWLDQVVRPERDARMSAFDWRVFRCERETRCGLTTTDNLTELDAYMQALADLPATLTEVGTIPWPDEP